MNYEPKMIYVAGKYTAPNKLERSLNIIKAKETAVEVFNKGHYALCPHTNSGGFEDLTLDMNARDWYHATMEMMERCDAVLMLDNWEDSIGSVAERMRAKELKMPIFYSLDHMTWAYGSKDKKNYDDHGFYK